METKSVLHESFSISTNPVEAWLNGGVCSRIQSVVERFIRDESGISKTGLVIGFCLMLVVSTYLCGSCGVIGGSGRGPYSVPTDIPAPGAPGRPTLQIPGGPSDGSDTNPFSESPDQPESNPLSVPLCNSEVGCVEYYDTSQ